MADKKYDEFPEVTTLLDTDICLISRAPHTPGNTKKYQQVNLKAYVLAGLGNMSLQNSGAVAITGGTIDGTPIGATAPSTVKSTTLTSTSLSVAGVVHNSAAGLLTTSLIVSGDITANSITNAKLDQMPANTFKANITGVAADPQDITVADLKGILGITTLGSMAYQDSTAISVTGGTIDGVTIGATTPSSIVGTTLTVNTLGLGIVHSSAGGAFSSSLVVNADISASAAIADTKLGTISTAGKVSNSATTAVSTNTASTIVLRDGSGNFSAGTITASLSGNATTSTTSTNFSGSLAGDVSGTQGATVIGNATITNAKMAQMAANTLKGNNTASPATPLDLTATQARTVLGLGSMALQAASAVAITGGTISGTDFTMSAATNSFNIANGGVFLKFNSVDGLSQNGGAIANAALTGGTINNAPIGATTPNTGVFTKLTVNSTTLSSRPYPSVTTTQKNALSATAGDIVWDSTLSQLFLYNGSTWITYATTGGSGFLVAANNLSDVASASTSRTNLGLGTMATQNASAVSITGGSITGANFTMSATTQSFLITDGGVFIRFDPTHGLDLNGAEITNSSWSGGGISATTLDSTPIGNTTRSTIKGTTIDANVGLTLPTSGGTPSTFNYYEEAATILIPVSGPWAAQNLSVTFTRSGRMVNLSWSDLSVAITVASQKISSSVGGVPSRFRPAASTRFAEIINGVTSTSEAPGIVKILSGGAISFAAEGDNVFAASGFAGVVAGSIDYVV